MVEIELTRRGRKRKYKLDIPMVMHLSGSLKSGDIAKQFDAPVEVIVKIADGRYVLEEDELDLKRIESLGLKMCGCCRKRIVPLVQIKTNGYYVRLRRLCSFCYKYGDCGAFEDHRLNINKNNIPA